MSTFKERPILFSGTMIRAILDGRKTQTRRVVKRQGDMEFDPKDPHYGPYWLPYACDADGEASRVRCPYGIPGDRLWVRETWQHFHNDGRSLSDYEEWECTPMNCFYRANESDPTTKPISGRWRPSIFMPRWASRILLEVTDISVERLQDISDDDARSEGYDRSHAFPREWFALLWEDINGPGSWSSNPWVWCISFRRLC